MNWLVLFSTNTLTAITILLTCVQATAMTGLTRRREAKDIIPEK